MNPRPTLFTLFILAASCAMPGAAEDGSSPPPHDPTLELLEVATNPANNDPRLFLSYNPAGPVRWNQQWPWKFDLSGVGWNIASTVTAITPRHVVMADHFRRQVGAAAVFHDRKGRAHLRKIKQLVSLKDAGLQCDIAVGLLDKPLPASIRTYPLLDPRDDYNNSLSGAVALVTEQKRRLYFHAIHRIHGNVLQLSTDKRIDDSRRKQLIVGDSGNPSFILSNGELVLVETHTGGGAGTGPFYGTPEVIETLKKVISQLDPKYQLQTIALDAKTREAAKLGRTNWPQPTTKRPAPSPAPTRPSTPNNPRKPRPRVIVPNNG